MTAHPLELTRSSTSTAQSVTLSVLIPFYGDDPRPLLESLVAQAQPGIEIILFDDGAPDTVLSDAVTQAVTLADAAVTLITSPVNQGRSCARNALANAALGDWLLFLDADMEINPGFVNRWRETVEATEQDALFGGYAPCEPRSEHEHVHAALAHASDAVDAETRSSQGAFAVCSSNLAVRASLFAQCPFDDGYTGWGWEDVDWALSAAQIGSLGHVDIPAAHGGLQAPDELLAKFDRAGANFARLLDRHPAYEARPGARLARKLQASGMALPARLIGRSLALSSWAPIKARVLALKLFRAGAAARDLPRGRA
ncbi:glycosyltransferase family 2 protein [Oceanicaulis sp. LC35]|uniref:glycosyltransferase family 2 protein n=1 Tax=Oceanicaulis sp. LC35 TaxID=3349635 RepID=UPI003F864221